jgi:hypothetical protein
MTSRHAASRAASILILSSTFLACSGAGGRSEAAPGGGPDASPSATAAPVGSVTPAAPANSAPAAAAGSTGARKAPDTTTGMAAKPAASPSDSVPLHDSAFGPKFTMDSTGKIVPIKRP